MLVWVEHQGGCLWEEEGAREQPCTWLLKEREGLETWNSSVGRIDMEERMIGARRETRRKARTKKREDKNLQIVLSMTL